LIVASLVVHVSAIANQLPEDSSEITYYVRRDAKLFTCSQ